jgi:hypothetical protein
LPQFLKRYSFCQYSIPNVRVQATRLDQVDLGRQFVPQIRQQPTEVKKVSALIEVHEEIYIAVDPVFTGRDRAKNTNVPAAMKCRQPENLGSFLGT